ncbi:MAG: prephenate dehydrogenase/arogenate dehydrogenase family protein, partial [Alphaproteobacteria bacterium]|nr:prephenate dehydrogenase/arogenate dehydrogenase family protein [Alphaproteobacteria bacterium]
MAIIFNKISVIGLGLIGTSILHAINVREDKKTITFAYDINPEHRSIVSEMNIATYVCSDIKEAIKESDLIILAIPVGAMKVVTDLIVPHLKYGALVTDTGSTKLSVIRDIKPSIPSDNYFIPSHPLAGTEYSGPKSGFSALFENRYWLIVSDKETQQTKEL